LAMSESIPTRVMAGEVDPFSGRSLFASAWLASATSDEATAFAGLGCVTKDRSGNRTGFAAGVPPRGVGAGDEIFSVMLVAFAAIVCVSGLASCPPAALFACVIQTELSAAWFAAGGTPASFKTCGTAKVCCAAVRKASPNPFCRRLEVLFVVFTLASSPACAGEVTGNELLTIACPESANFAAGTLEPGAGVAGPASPAPNPSIEFDLDAPTGTLAPGMTGSCAVSPATTAGITFPAVPGPALASAVLRGDQGPFGIVDFAAVAASPLVSPEIPVPEASGAEADGLGSPKKPCTAAANCAANPPATETPPPDDAPLLPGTIRKLLEPISPVAFTLFGAPDFFGDAKVSLHLDSQACIEGRRTWKSRNSTFCRQY
jgi:hypothetical protein